MFAQLTIKELKLLIRELRDHHSIKNYSKMKKPELVVALSDRFNMVNGNLYLREDVRPMKAPKPSPEELKPLLAKYLRALSPAEYNLTAKQIKNEFLQAMTGIDMAPHKALFKELSRAESEKHEEPKKTEKKLKQMRPIPRDAGVKGKNRYATTRPV